ncbi:MAG TPA: 5-oxoprolinase subunit PxpB [Bryobacteraceae bacterium]|nr:5-oxoprolinase subunit PxpB [Bryobacteraceae bacterium]
MTISPASDRSLLVAFGDSISLETHRQVFHLTRAMHGLRGLLNLHPAYASLLVEFDPRFLDHAQAEALIREKLAVEAAAEHHQEARLVEIPVYYGGEFGPDLADVAAHTGLTPEQVIELHAATEYLVYFLGFAPGFAYLGGLPAQLATPRLSAPRKRVPAGSVAIGGNQTGVYPIPSPGGWRIIGHTDAKLFDPSAAEPVLLRMGDRLRFVRTNP